MDLSDEVTLLATRYLKDYKLLIMLRDGMYWPNGYASSEGIGDRGSVSVPSLPAMEEKPHRV